MESTKRLRTAYATPIQTHGTSFALPGHQETPVAYASQTGDILDYLKGRGGRIKELEDAVTEQRSAREQLQQQVDAANEQIKTLQQQLATAAANIHTQGSTQAASQKQQVVYVAELEKLMDEQLVKVLKLEQQLSAANEKLASTDAARTSAVAALTASQAQVQRLEQEASAAAATATRELSNAKTEAAERIARAELQARMEASRAAAAVEVQNALQEALHEAQALVATRSDEMARMRKELALYRSGAAQATSPTALTHNGLPRQRVLELESKVKELDALLQSRNEQIVQLQSQIQTSNAAGENVDPNALATNPTHQLAEAQRLLQQWAEVALALPGASGGDPASCKAAAALLADRLSEATTALQARDGELMQLRAAADTAAAAQGQQSQLLAELRAAANAATTQNKLLERHMSVMAQERDSLRTALTTPLPGSSGSGNSSSSDTIAAKLAFAQAASRAAQAETRVLDLTHQLEMCQSEMTRLAKEKNEAVEAAESAAARATTAEARVRRLEAEADNLARDVAGLQEKLGKGEFNRSTSTRVLHLRMNPERELTKQAEAGRVGELEAQVAALTTSLETTQAALAAMEARATAAEQDLEDAGQQPAAGKASAAARTSDHGGSATSVAELMSSLSAREAEVAVLRHKLSEADKAGTRLREVFKERAAAFREAVYCLFGYRVDMASEATAASAAGTAPTTFSLRPQHADSPDAVLLFRYTPESGMKIVPTAFTQSRLSREVDTFITRFRCIPAFTANLTMEWFQKQTQC